MSDSQELILANENARKILEALVVDNSDLERLEALLDQFNIFEVIGAVRQELRHSEFLAFLLNPQQNHGFGDVFLKRLLQKVLVSTESTSVPITSIDLDVWNLGQIIVLREWQNIDILLLDELNQLAVIIENKIDTNEHSNQLERYYHNVCQQYTDWKVIGLYLTPEGKPSLHQAYLPVDYGLICNLIEGITETRSSTLGADVLTVIKHYTQMLRRHILNESEIAHLCRRIYQKHQRALDLIYEHRPDRQAEIREVLEGFIQKTPGFVLDHCSKSSIRFAPQEWDVTILQEGQGWTRSKRILLFEFRNDIDSLKLRLIIGPGPQETRQNLYKMAYNKQSPFKIANNRLFNNWNTIYDHTFLTSRSYEDASINKLIEEISKHWDKFIKNDFPSINGTIKAERWIWEPIHSHVVE